MSRTAILPPDERTPTWLGLALWQGRLALLRLKRHALDLARPVRRCRREVLSGLDQVVATNTTPLATAQDPRERPLEFGKIQNLRVAARRLDGIVVRQGKTFSFWRQLGRCTRRRGYVAGRQLQEGCLVPALGGGICQLSNAIYDVALQAGCRILERHPHTRVVPGSAASADRDATVAWNHIDLRWQAPVDMRLFVRLTQTDLVVELRAAGEAAPPAPPRRTALRQVIDPAAHTCGVCGRTECVLHDSGPAPAGARTAVLVDEWWPEFDAWLAGQETDLCIPLDGAKWKRPAYRWTTEGYGRVHQAVEPTLRRAWQARRLTEQGAARQAARLSANEELAEAYGRSLGYDVTHLVVAIDLLPHLFFGGHLGGRTYDVLLTRFPLAELHARLDAAHDRHPDRRLLRDFRASLPLVTAETFLLQSARRLVTPHRAFMAGDPRLQLLDWRLPDADRVEADPAEFIVFPGPTVSRKGAFEVREAARNLGLPVMPLGSELEGPDFWDGVRVLPADPEWPRLPCVVVQPAVLEDRPRTLLRAVAAGRPVVCTEACGVAGLPGVSVVSVSAPEVLAATIRTMLAPS